jgi:hypothetical protein
VSVRVYVMMARIAREGSGRYMTPTPRGSARVAAEVWRRYRWAVCLLLLAAWVVFELRGGATLGVPAALVWLGVVAGAAAAMVLWRAAGGRDGIAQAALIVGVLAFWAIADANILNGFAGSGFGLYDLHVYLAGGERYLAGANPYLAAPLTSLPPSADVDPFLYPPVFLPLFGALAHLPIAVVSVGWVALLFAAGLLALRLIGLPWLLAVVFLFFPPLFKGVDSGNVANVVFLLFAAGGYIGPLLVFGGLLKLQAAVPPLWLVRERRWGALVIGLVLVGLFAAVFVFALGTELWADWLRGLVFREASQHNVPILYGDSLARFLPIWAFVVLAVAAVALALIPAGRRGLAAMGLASVVATPSLWPHGFPLALPALLYLDAPLFWLAVGMGSVGFGRWWLVVFGAAAVIGSRVSPIDREADGVFGPGPWSRSSSG